jgi:hypothetical protein
VNGEFRRKPRTPPRPPHHATGTLVDA